MTLADLLELDGPAVRVILTPAQHRAELAPDVSPPEGVCIADDGSLEILSTGAGAGWTFLSGNSGQYGYAGPIMHPSEQLDGHLEREILSRPGVYALVIVNSHDYDEPAGWAVAYLSEDI